MRRRPIAPGFRMLRPTQAGGPDQVWSDTSLRVRVGVTYTSEYRAHYDPVHRRVDYFGPGVNLAARVESVANGGQVVLTAPAAAQLQHEQRRPESVTTTEENPPHVPTSSSASEPHADTPHHDSPLGAHTNTLFASPPEFRDVAANDHDEAHGPDQALLSDTLVVAPFAHAVELRGVAERIDLYTVMPQSLSARRFHYGPVHRGKSQTDLLAASNRRTSFTIHSGKESSSRARQYSLTSDAAPRPYPE
mmetsp:Transcript_48785/g.150680  ORF Transcript_48785/g.150680 Transcript_48785/m.150680 type:complete len:248 (-) Transcript_48785:90-833(-)